MKAIKILVVVFGIGLVLGFVLLYQKIQEKNARKAVMPPPQVVERLDLPPGSAVSSVTAGEYGWGLLIQGEGAQTFILLDKNGLLKRRIALVPGVAE